MAAKTDESSPAVAPASSSSPVPSSGRHQLRPVKFDYADSFACTYIVSVVAASIAELATYPLDLTKTRLQIQGEGAAQSAVKSNVSGTYRYRLPASHLPLVVLVVTGFWLLLIPKLIPLPVTHPMAHKLNHTWSNGTR